MVVIHHAGAVLRESVPGDTLSADLGFIGPLLLIILSLGHLLVRSDQQIVRDVGQVMRFASPPLYVLGSALGVEYPNPDDNLRALQVDPMPFWLLLGALVVVMIGLSVYGMALGIRGIVLDQPEMAQRGEAHTNLGAVLGVCIAVLAAAASLI